MFQISLKRIVIVCIFLFYASTNSFWGYRLFHENDYFAALACVLPMTIVMINLIMTRKIRIDGGVILLIATLYVVILISSVFRIKYILFYGCCFSLFLLGDLSKCDDMLKLFYYLAIFFSIGSAINYFLPDFYKSFILKGFENSSMYNSLQSWFKYKHIIMRLPGFANQTSFNACHFVYGIGYLVSKYSVVKKLKFTEWLSCALFVICLVLTIKRAHFLIAIMVSFVCYYCSSRQKSKQLQILLFMTLVFLPILYYLISHIEIGVFGKLNTMITNLENDEDISSGRFALYSLALKYFSQHPFMGIGWEQYRTISELSAQSATHNIYLELLCETGVLGFFCFLLFFIALLSMAFVNCKRANEDRQRVATVFCLYMQLFFLVYGLSGNPLYDPPYYFPYFLICAFTSSLRIRIKTNPNLPEKDNSLDAMFLRIQALYNEEGAYDI